MSGGMKWGRARHELARGRERPGWVRLSCGCDTNRQPKLSNPEKWFCCHGWQTRVNPSK